MYALKKVTEKIYVAIFLDHYDLTMTFFRTDTQFHGMHGQTMSGAWDFQEGLKRRRTEEGAFVYPAEVGALCFSSDEVETALEFASGNETKWDFIMGAIYGRIRARTSDTFVLIGLSADLDIREYYSHELAHALWSTNPDYQEEMAQAMLELDPVLRDQATQVLFNWGYPPNLFEDEMHAYMATGLEGMLSDVVSPEDVAPLREIFSRYWVDDIKNVGNLCFGEA